MVIEMGYLFLYPLADVLKVAVLVLEVSVGDIGDCFNPVELFDLLLLVIEEEVVVVDYVVLFVADPFIVQFGFQLLLFLDIG